MFSYSQRSKCADLLNRFSFLLSVDPGMNDRTDMLVYKRRHDRIQSAFYNVKRDDCEKSECVKVCDRRVDLCSHRDDILDSAESNFCVERKSDRSVYKYCTDNCTEYTDNKSDHRCLFRLMSAVDQSCRHGEHTASDDVSKLTDIVSACSV